jgi:hypothetical protein
VSHATSGLNSDNAPYTVSLRIHNLPREVSSLHQLKFEAKFRAHRNLRIHSHPLCRNQAQYSTRSSRDRLPPKRRNHSHNHGTNRSGSTDL